MGFWKRLLGRGSTPAGAPSEHPVPRGAQAPGGTSKTTVHVFIEGSQELLPGLLTHLATAVREGADALPDSCVFCYRVDPWRSDTDIEQYAKNAIRQAGRLPSENHALFFSHGVGEGKIEGLHFCGVTLVSGFEIKSV